MKSEPLNDGELLNAYLNNDDAAFDEIMRRHGKMVYYTALRICKKEDLAEDAAQAVFLVLLQKAGNLRKEVSMAGWLHKIAKNLSRNMLLSEARRKRREETTAAGRQTRNASTLERCMKKRIPARLRSIL